MLALCIGGVASYIGMQIEQEKPKKPNFAVVVALFAAMTVLIIIAAIAILTWRAKSASKAPFTKHPLSQLTSPDHLPFAG